MRTFTTLQTRIFRFCALQCVMLSAGLLLTLLFAGSAGRSPGPGIRTSSQCAAAQIALSPVCQEREAVPRARCADCASRSADA